MEVTFSDLLWRVIALIFLLSFSAFFSSSETALFSLNRSRISRMRSGPRGERLAARLLEDPQRLLSTIIIGNLFVNVFLASLIADLGRILLGEGGVPIAIFSSTALLLVFGEVTPKTIAVGKAPSIARKVSLPLTVMAVCFMPMRILLKLAANAVLFLFGQQTVKGWPGVTLEEVSAVVALGEAQGVATSKERVLLENILDVTTVEAHSLMVPRTEIRGIEDSLTIAEALLAARSCQHSRLPIYHDSLDDSWGVFAAVDVVRSCDDSMMDRRLAEFREDVKSSNMPLPDIPIYPALLAPETVRLDHLLDEMRKRRAGAALLVDEYGGTAGMLTIDDILAEIVGHSSPGDQAAKAGIMLREGFVLAEGGTPIREFNRILDADLKINGSDTLGGYVMERLGRVPRAGDSFVEDGCRFQVVKMAGRRIGSLRFEQADQTGGEA